MRAISLRYLSAALFMAWNLSIVISPGQETEDIKGTIKTEYGRVYREVEVLDRDPHGLTFRHAKGIAKIPFSEFSEEIRRKYQYDKKSALKFLNEHASVESGPGDGLVALNRRGRPVAVEFLPGAYTSFVGGVPITYAGSSVIDARRAAECHSPSWVYPTPVNAPLEMYLWRQLSVQQHLLDARTHPCVGHLEAMETCTAFIATAAGFRGWLTSQLPRLAWVRGLPRSDSIGAFPTEGLSGGGDGEAC